MIKILVFILLLTPVMVNAAQYKIVAVVNDDVISNYSLDERVALAIKSSGLPNTSETKKKISGQVLQILIDEKLKLQEAKRLRINVPEDEIKEAVSEMEAQNKIARGGFAIFLKQNNLSEESAKEQIRSQLAWKKIILQKIRPKIVISDNEIDQSYQSMIAKSNTRQVNISEIIIPVAEDNEDDAKALAKKLFNDIKSESAEFDLVARQFSISNSAEKGGEIGWVQEASLDKVISTAISKLKPDGISSPIRTDKGYHIIKLHQVKDFSELSEDGTIKFKQAFFAFTPKMKKEDADKVRQEMKKFALKISNCQKMEKTPHDIRLSFRDFGSMKISNLASEVRSALVSLSAGETSDVLVTPTGFSIFTVCERISEPKEKEAPDRDKIRNMLGVQKMELEARRYLKNLHNQAFIEMRQ